MSRLSLLLIIFSYFELNGQIIPNTRVTDWSEAGAQSSFYDTTVSILNYGGDLSGATDNSVALNAAISSLNNGGTIFFPAGTYLFNSTQNIQAGIKIKGAGASQTTFNFDNSGTGDMFLVSGSVLPGFDTLIGGFSKDSRTLMVNDASIYQSTKYLRLTEDHDGRMFSSWAYNALGQIFKIDSIDVVNNILFIDQPLRHNYDSNLSPKLRKLVLKENVGFECFTMNRLDATTAQTANINFTYTANCYVKDVESYLTNFSHIKIQNSTNISVKNSFFKDGHDYGGGGKAYGVTIQATSGNNLIENNVFKHLRHSVLLQSSANGNVISYNYSHDPFWVAGSLASNAAGDLVLHGNYTYMNLFEGNICQNIVVDNSHGINGPYNTFFRNRAESFGIFMNTTPPSNSQHYIANEITDTTIGFYFIQGTDHITYGNNNRGAITPAGTDTLSRKSYYINSMPLYWNINDLWPTIGIENTANSFVNPAYTRYYNGNNTECRGDTSFYDLVICPSRDFVFNSKTYTTAGVYFDSTINIGGEVTYYQLNLNSANKPTVNINGTNVDASHGYSYAWYINDSLQQGAVNQAIAITKNGYYQVLVTDSIGCSQLSDSVLVQTAGVKQVFNDGLIIFPNPVKDAFTIQQSNLIYSRYQLFDVRGKLILEGDLIDNKSTVNVLSLETGVYFVNIQSNNNQLVKKIIRQ